MRRKPGRPKAGQDALTRQSILDAALRLADEEGVEALSMRRLGRELGVDPMALYHHIPNKKALVSGIVELVFSSWDAPRGHASGWRSQVRMFARSYRDLVRAHPRLVLHVILEPEAGAEAGLDANEFLYRALEAAGLSPRDIVRSADLIVDYLNGFALAEASGRLGQAGERAADLSAIDRAQQGRYPVSHRVLREVAGCGPKGDFESGLEIILIGVAALAGEHGSLT